MALILVGYRGSGKTTVTRLLAGRLGCAALDTDEEIAARAGMSIPRIFAIEGEEGFRERERDRLLEALRRDPPWVLATGGGIVERADNRRALRAHPAAVVYLRVPVAELQHRLRTDPVGRPSLTGGDPADEVAKVLARREDLYRAVADRCVDAAGDLEGIVVELSELWKTFRKRSKARSSGTRSGC